MCWHDPIIGLSKALIMNASVLDASMYISQTHVPVAKKNICHLHLNFALCVFDVKIMTFQTKSGYKQKQIGFWD
jgi:hypothetical protein